MSQLRSNKASVYEYVESQKWRYKVERDDDKRYIISLGMNLKSRLSSCRVLIEATETEIQAYGVCPINATSQFYGPVVEYITRANYGLKVGAFEFDYSDGEVRYHTCLSCKEGVPSQKDVERTVDMSFLMMDRYGDGLAKNLMGFGNPEQDIREAESK